MILEDEVLKEAKWLYAANAGSSLEDMKRYVKQAVKTLHFEDEMVATCRLFQITIDEYIEQRAKDTLAEILLENSKVGNVPKKRRKRRKKEIYSNEEVTEKCI